MNFFGSLTVFASVIIVSLPDYLEASSRARCDKLAELLKWSNMSNAKVLSDLKNSGIDFKISSNRHTTPNVEFKSTLAKCKRLLTAFPLNKRALMLFRSITDTVTDGRLDLMGHIGIFIDLTNPNMATLKKKIDSKRAEREAQGLPAQVEPKIPQRPRAQVEPARPRAGPASRINALKRKSNGQFARTQPAAALPKLPSGITISKVKQDQIVKRQEEPEPEIKKEPIEQSLILERPMTRTVTAAETYEREMTVNQAKVKKALNDIRRKMPANRQMSTDVIFDTLHLRTDSSALLAEHGIIYNQKLGNYHLRVLSGQRKSIKNQ